MYYISSPEPAVPKRDSKTERLQRDGVLNRHPESVKAPWFADQGFFDARDLVQVKYEMLRHVRVDGGTKSTAATLFGVSRPTLYQAEAAFARDGLSGLLPRSRGPKRAHKLTPEVMTAVEAKLATEPNLGARVMSRYLQTELGVTIHPRSIERALARKKKR